MTIPWRHVRAAALLNAAVALATFGVAVGLIGLGVLFDRERFLRMAVENPGPILLQDTLKLVSAMASILLVGAFHARLHPESPVRMNVATGAGALAIVTLLSNAALSVYGVLKAETMDAATAARLNVGVGILALVVLMASGVWYLLANLVALGADALPHGLARLGLAVGVASLLPPLGIVALVLSAAWSIGLAMTSPPEVVFRTSD